MNARDEEVRSGARRARRFAYAAMLLLATPYLLPFVTSVQREWLAFRLVEPVLVALVFRSLVQARPAIREGGRRLWLGLSVGFGIWLGVALAGLVAGALVALPIWALTKDAFYLGYYAAILWALDTWMWREETPIVDASTTFARVSASWLLLLGLFGYESLISAFGDIASYRSPFWIYAILDLVVAVRFGLLARASIGGWRQVHGLLSVGFGLFVGSDLLGWADRAGRIDLSGGSALALLWMIPYLPLLAMPAHAVGLAAPRRALTGTGSGLGSWAPPVLYALLFPAFHTGGYAAGALDPAIRKPRDGFIVVWLVAVGIALVIGYTLLELRARRAEASRDLLERRVIRAQRLEASGQLARGIAHDFNNVLTAVLGYAELGLADAEGDHRRTLEETRKASLRARDLAQRLLAFGADAEATPRRRVAAAEVLDGFRLLMGPEDGRDIRLRIADEAPAVRVHVETTQIEQALLNLGLNAVAACEGRGTIGVRAHRVLQQGRCASCGAIEDGEYLAFDVTDEGPGIDSELAGRIFEPLVTSKSAGEGSGMGLAMVHGIVHAHGGHVDVRSTEAGSRFTILLPLA